MTLNLSDYTENVTYSEYHENFTRFEYHENLSIFYSGNGGIPVSELVVVLARLMWWYAVVMAGIGTVLNLYGAMYLIMRASRCTSFPCLISIVFADCAFLIIVFVCLLTAQIFPFFSGVALCKIMIFVTNTSSLFSNWCWVILWGGRYVAVFHPWLHFRYKYLRTSLYLPMLLIVCICLESWTLMFATEVDKTCDLDEKLVSYKNFKYVFLAESFLQFFVPFFLIVAADVSVFSRTYYKRKPTLEQMESNELRPASPRNLSKTNVETVMIVSQEYKIHAQACKHRMIKRFVILASVDLLLNFPHVILNIIEGFQRGTGQYFLPYPINYLVIAISFSLFYLQYVFNIVHIHLLVSDFSRKRDSAKKRKVTTSLSTQSSSRSMRRSRKIG